MELPLFNSNDGYEISINQQISQIQQEIYDMVIDNNKTIIALQSGQYLDQQLLLINNDKQQLNCSGFASCLNSQIIVKNSTICNIICLEQLSCFLLFVNIDGCDNIKIICNGERACDSMDMQINALNNNDNNNQLLLIKCGISKSCNDININITGNILQYNMLWIKSCDDMIINIDPNYYQNSFLNMHPYSEILYFQWIWLSRNR